MNLLESQMHRAGGYTDSWKINNARHLNNSQHSLKDFFGSRSELAVT